MGKKGINRIDITGQKFGRLTVVRDSGERKNQQVVWLCKCDCGKEYKVRSESLRRGFTKSCGCSKYEKPSNFYVNLLENTNISHLNGNIPKNNKSGVKGVFWDKRSKKWKATIGFKREIIYLGLYDNLEDAAQARKEAEEKYFKPILDKYGKKED